jgi:3-phenylpropionate/trans-cinnamate dioxygenase ferredoxin reductase subunit
LNSQHVKYLLIGGGLAASSAAQAIREIDHDGSAMLVGQEIMRPYHRPPLSKEFLRRQKGREELFAVEPGWFEKNNVELHTGRRAAHLDPARGAVTLDDGAVISYDRLLLAIGASPRLLDTPGADLPNLFYLRTIEDTVRLQTAADKAKREGRVHAGGRGRVAIIGAGVLGVELAASFVQMGLAVDLLCAKAHPWDKFAGELTGKFLTRFLEQHGVRVHINARPARLEGDGRVQHVNLGDGRIIDCDFTVATVGATVNRELLRGTPIAAERAILTDDHCRTNVLNIYAAGDCAAIFDPLFGKHRQLDHWDNAIVSGKLAGRNMAGVDEPYRAVNNFFSDVFELSLNAWGESRHVERRLHRGTPNGTSIGGGFAEIGFTADGRIAQVLSIGRTGEDELFRELVARRLRVDGKEELLKDPDAPLKAVLD